MAKQVFYEDVSEGFELPILVKKPSKMQLVMWAGASGDYMPLHYDKDFAQAAGLPGVIVHGWLTCSFLGQMLTDWIGDEGFVKKLGVQYRGMNFPDEDIICKGKVTKKFVEGKDHLVECEIWAENAKGERTTPGTAVVILPSRRK